MEKISVLVDSALRVVSALDRPLKNVKTRLSSGSKMHPELELKQFPAEKRDLNYENFYAGILRSEYN